MFPAQGTCFWHSDDVLSEMRNDRGRPNWRMRVLAVVLALLLAGPLTVFLLQAAAKVLDLAI